MGTLASDMNVGPYTGHLVDRLSTEDLIEVLRDFSSQHTVWGGDIPLPGRNRVVRVALSRDDNLVDLSIKSFARRNAVKDYFDTRHGSRAHRSWLMARALEERNIGTAPPIGYLDRWEDKRLCESYYLCMHQHDAVSFRDELIRLYTTDPMCDKIMALMECVANALKQMHDSGFVHRDLGNQNILLDRTGDAEWGNVRFIDLNRARTVDEISNRQRAKDLARIALPSDFLRVFREMYFHDEPPDSFQWWEAWYRRCFSLHTRSRRFRHPIRTVRERERAAQPPKYPPEKDIWVWDERSVQAVGPLQSRDRRRCRPVSGHLRVAATVLAEWLPLYCRYRSLLAQCYRQPIPMAGTIGMAVSSDIRKAEREAALLARLGKLPVLLRFYRHKGPDSWKDAAEIVRRLKKAGHSVSVALVQDRESVLEPRKWHAFTAAVLESVREHVDWVEAAHAINRSKWGVWSLDDHSKLMCAVDELAHRYPDVRFVGPAAIDFEYPFLLAALRNLPGTFRFDALSHHLYVDRRGAPECAQGFFSALDKFAFARAIAERSPRCEPKFVVSEVNWPLEGTGVYSPVGSPYESPGERYDDPSVSPELYSDYMLRYLLIAVCSGMVARVYWWQLVARGFGLVDDTNTGKWQPRPAFDALRFFLSRVGQGTFTRKIPSNRVGVEILAFASQDKEDTAVAWSFDGPVRMPVPFEFREAVDSRGNKITAGGDIEIDGSPVYLLGINT